MKNLYLFPNCLTFQLHYTACTLENDLLLQAFDVIRFIKFYLVVNFVMGSSGSHPLVQAHTIAGVVGCLLPHLPVFIPFVIERSDIDCLFKETNFYSVVKTEWFLERQVFSLK